MMSTLYVDNAISWAQFNVKGGLRNSLYIGIGYALFITALTEHFATTPGISQHLYSIWTGAVLVIQGMLLILYVPTRVSAAIRADLASRLIESHRLMPLSPRQAVIGYIAGSLARLWGIYVANFVIGAITTVLAQVPIGNWIIGHAIGLCLGMLVWSLMALTGFLMARGMVWIIGIVSTIASMSGGAAFISLPGLLVLFGPLFGSGLFHSQGAQSPLSNVLVVAIAAQLGYALLAIGGAARKYARDDAIALPAASMVAALLIWVGLSAVGITFFDELIPRTYYYDSSMLPAQIIGSMISSLLIAMGAMASTAWAVIAYHAHRRAGDANLPRRPLPAIFVIAFCVIVILLLTWLIPPGVTKTSLAPTATIPMIRLALALSFGLALANAYLLMRMCYTWMPRPNILIGIVLLGLWVAPLIADEIYASVNDIHDLAFEQFSGASPLGTMIRVYGPSRPIHRATLITDIVMQGIICAGLGALLAMFNRRRKRKQVLPAFPPPLPHSLAPPLSPLADAPIPPPLPSSPPVGK